MHERINTMPEIPAFDEQVRKAFENTGAATKGFMEYVRENLMPGSRGFSPVGVELLVQRSSRSGGVYPPLVRHYDYFYPLANQPGQAPALRTPDTTKQVQRWQVLPPASYFPRLIAT